MKALLDTNVLLRLHLQSKKLGVRTQSLLSSANSLFYSPLSLFELLQSEQVRPHVITDFVQATESIGIQELPLTARAAMEARRFGNLRGRDPMDFLILSQAAEAGLVLFTADLRLLGLGLPFIKDATL